MKDKPVSKRIMRIQNKGMVTLPIIFRRKLNIEENDLVEVELKGDELIIRKISQEKSKNKDFNLYSEQDIQEMLKNDILHPKIAKKLHNLLI